MSEPLRADRHRALRPRDGGVRRLLPPRQRRLARRQPRPAGVRLVGRVPRGERAQPGAAAPAAARTRRPRRRRSGVGRPDGRATTSPRRWTRRRSPRPARSRSSRYLARIDAAGSVADVRELVRDLQRVGVGRAPLARRRAGLRGLGRLPRLRRPGRPGPARARLLHARRRASVAAARRVRGPRRAASSATSATAESDARGDAAERILAFETRLAEASYTAEQMRDVQLTMNRHDVAALDELMPGFGLSGYVARPRRHLADASTSTTPASSRRSTSRSPTRPIETLRDYLRWHLVRTFAIVALARVRGRGVRLLRPDARRAAGDAAALEARARRGHRGHRRAGRAALRRGRVLRAGQAALRGDGRPPAVGDGRARSAAPSG